VLYRVSTIGLRDCTSYIAVRELQGSVTGLILTLDAITENTTSTSADSNSSLALMIAADITEVIVSDLQPDTLYSAVLTLTVHGGHNITSDPEVTRTSSGGQQIHYSSVSSSLVIRKVSLSFTALIGAVTCLSATNQLSPKNPLQQFQCNRFP